MFAPSHAAIEKNRTGKTPFLYAKVQNASACLELLREKHGRPTPEEDSFDFGYVAAAPLESGSIERGAGGSMRFKTVCNPFAPGFVPVPEVSSDP